MKHPPKPEFIPPLPPEYLSAKSKGLWVALARERIRGLARLTLLESALAALDRSEQARLALLQHGLVTVTETTGVTHVNPLVKVERESRALHARLWDMLGLSHWTMED